MNCMGAHFNPVSFSIVNSESKEGIENSYKATCGGLYSMYNSATLCSNAECGFWQITHQMTNPIEPEKGAEWARCLLTVDAQQLHYQLDNPCSDNSSAYYSTAKKLLVWSPPPGSVGGRVGGTSWSTGYATRL